MYNSLYNIIPFQELRTQHNTSPLDSSGSTADSYTSDTTLSAGSPGHQSISTDIPDSGKLHYTSQEESVIYTFCDECWQY